MKTTFYTAGGQQILLSPPLRDFRHPRRAQVSARCGTPPNPEFGHPSFKNSTKFNNRYVKLRSVVGGVVSSGLDSCFVSKRHKGWGYVNILQQIEAQMQYRLWYAQNAKAILCTKKSEKTVGNGMFSNKN